MTDSTQARRVLENLEVLAGKLGVQVVYGNLRGDEPPAEGGLCKVKGEYKIFLDRKEGTEGRIRILARALSSFNLDGIYLLPQIREILEKARL